MLAPAIKNTQGLLDKPSDAALSQSDRFIFLNPGTEDAVAKFLASLNSQTLYAGFGARNVSQSLIRLICSPTSEELSIAITNRASQIVGIAQLRRHYEIENCFELGVILDENLKTGATCMMLLGHLFSLAKEKGMHQICAQYREDNRQACRLSTISHRWGLHRSRQSLSRGDVQVVYLLEEKKGQAPFIKN